jgi:hypothetical protein
MSFGQLSVIVLLVLEQHWYGCKTNRAARRVDMILGIVRRFVDVVSYVAVQVLIITSARLGVCALFVWTVAVIGIDN